MSHGRWAAVATLAGCLALALAAPEAPEALALATPEAPAAAASKDKCNNTEGVKCRNGLLVPMWLPNKNLSLGDKIGRAVIYFLALIYLFLGVSVLADRFMAAIEVITSQERQITVKKANGEVYKVTVRIWNETVSNLTLMALGSSAPEILLSVIEVCGNNFSAGELGPNTIVGSAAFNLFMIIAICVYVIPSTEVRRQKHLRVFFVTATWSVFAYVWLYIILKQSSPDIVELWEALLTFLFFPITVVTAWIADRRLLIYKFVPRRYRKDHHGMLVGGEAGDVELEKGRDGSALAGDGATKKLMSGEPPLTVVDTTDPEVAAFEESRREFLEILRELRRKHPNCDLDSLQQMAEYEMLSRVRKSRAFYRVAAVRRLTGGGDIVKKKLDKVLPKKERGGESAEDKRARQTCRVFFDPGHYTVLENVGTFRVNVARDGGPPDLTIMVDYRTEDGSANAGSDYVATQGTLTFTPNILQQQVPVEIIDDDVFEEDEHFYIHLENLRVRTREGLIVDPVRVGGTAPPLAQLAAPFTATVMILDDDHAGVFSIEQKEYVVSENAGHLKIRVMRSSGARGRVIVPYRTEDGTAVSEKDYERKEDRLVFENDEVEKYIEIGIVNDEDYEKSEIFFLELGEPIWAKKLSDQQRVIERYKRRQRRKLAQMEDTQRTSVEKVKKFQKFAIADKKSQASEDTGRGTPQQDTVEDDEKVADLGKPRLGDVSKCIVKIKESNEFKGVVDRMIKTANISLVVGTSSWREQFVDALTVSAGGDDTSVEDKIEAGEDKIEALPTCGDYVMHFLSVPWKVLCALVPPTEYLNGWACFIVSICMIGLFTALIGDLANHFGCSIGLKDAVTAISFVAMGTSVPDTFASKVAAVQDKYADSSIGNVTGSNAVNVFLGIGVAWTIAAVYHLIVNGQPFSVDSGTLGFSVTVFCVEAVLAIFVLLLRRLDCVGGELGGPMRLKVATSFFLFMLWFIYVLLSSLEAYCVISGF